ncbi:MAG: hydroxymethylglutaryl-CoA lyase [Cyclobacteriaceae bacterium]
MKVVECPRDAMQGMERFVATNQKTAYINKLLKVGFDTIDFGSFVSPKAIPQMQDTAEVLSRLNLDDCKSRLLAIIANVRGAELGCIHNAIDDLGYPLSVSETFQQRNTKRTIEQAFIDLDQIQNLCIQNGKRLVVYLSMGFGNPYGDPYHPDLLGSFIDRLIAMEVKVISLSDTIGIATPQLITKTFEKLGPSFPSVELGAHLHAVPTVAGLNIQAAIDAGCERVDTAILGFGGCPMAKDDLTGNIDTSILLRMYPQEHFDMTAYQECVEMAQNIFQ